jgi:WD40 repeat protein
MLLAQRKRPPNAPLFLSFNSSQTHLLVGTTKGLRIFELDSNLGPRKVLVRESDMGSDYNLLNNSGGISSFDVLDSSNIFVLVAGGKLPKFDSSKVILWENINSQILIELEFSSCVKSAYLRSDLLFVLLTTKIVIYKLIIGESICKKLYEFDMFWNEYSAFGIASSMNGIILAFPARNKGQLQIVDITGCPLIPFTTICSGHDHSISSISMSKSGAFVATCSNKGTLIRIWHSKSGTLRHELRRGTDEADIYSMDFDGKESRLCVASDKGTNNINSRNCSYLQFGTSTSYENINGFFILAEILFI